MGHPEWASGYISAVNIRRRGVVIHAEMARPLLWACAAALFLAAPAAAAAEICNASQQQAPQQQRGAQAPAGKSDRPGEHNGQPNRPKWWIDPKLRAELGISDQQSALVEQIWQKSTPKILEAREKLKQLEDTLAQLTRDESIDEAKIIAQIDQVEQMRAEANKRRTLMIYRMNKILKPDQRAKVEALFKRPDPPKRDSHK